MQAGFPNHAGTNSIRRTANRAVFPCPSFRGRRLAYARRTFSRNYFGIGVFTLSFAAKCRGDGERQYQTEKRSVRSRTRRDRYAQVHGPSFGGSGIRHVHNGCIRGKRRPSSPRQAASQAAPSPSQITQSASTRYPSSLCVLTGNGFHPNLSGAGRHHVLDLTLSFVKL
jgi:hypothetical protein